MKEADNAPTMLARERILKHQTPEKAAAVLDMSLTRYTRLEEGTSSQPPTAAEAAALRKYAPGLTPDEALSDNTVELRHKVRF
jgi:transcriptional regulator with XRE-family HTH domain